MPALAIGLGAPGDLHRERQLLARHPGEDPRVEHGAEVVRVRDEGVAVAVLQEGVEHPRGDERRVEVAVAGGRPFERRVALPRDGLQVVGVDLRHLVLQEVERHVGLDLRVAAQRRQRVLARGEGVHEHERHARAEALAQREHLADDDVQEGLPGLGLDQRLGLGHAHARAQAAVELEHDRGVDDRRRRPRAGRRAWAGPRRARCRSRAASPRRPRATARSSGRRCRSRRRRRPRRASSRCSPAARRGSCVVVVAMHCVRREGGQADGDVLGAAGVGRRVAHPLAAAHEDGLAGADVERRRPRARRSGCRRGRASTRRSRGAGRARPSPGASVMRATLRRSSPVFTRPTYSSISLGLVPAASTRLGFSMSSGIGTAAYWTQRPVRRRTAYERRRIVGPRGVGMGACAHTLTEGRSLAPLHRTAGRARRRRPLGSGACCAGGHEHEPHHPDQQHAGLGHAERPGRVRSRQRPAHVLGVPEHAQLQGARRRHRGGQQSGERRLRQVPDARPVPRPLRADRRRRGRGPRLPQAVRLHGQRRPARQQPLGQGQRHDRPGRAGVQHAAAHLPAPRQDAAGAQRRPQHRALDLEPHRGHRRPRRQRPAHEARHRRCSSEPGLRQRAAVLDLVGREAGRRRRRATRSVPPAYGQAVPAVRHVRLHAQPAAGRLRHQEQPSPAASTATGRRWRSSTPSPRRPSSRTPTSTRRLTASRRWTSARSSPRTAPTIRSADPTSATRRAGTARRPSTSRPCTPWRPAPTSSSWAAPTASTSRSSTRSTRSSTATWPRSSRTPTATSARPARTPACARPGTTPSARPPSRASGCTSRRATAATRSTTSATPRPTSRPRTRW